MDLLIIKCSYFPEFKQQLCTIHGLYIMCKMLLKYTKIGLKYLPWQYNGSLIKLFYFNKLSQLIYLIILERYYFIMNDVIKYVVSYFQIKLILWNNIRIDVMNIWILHKKSNKTSLILVSIKKILIKHWQTGVRHCESKYLLV